MKRQFGLIGLIKSHPVGYLGVALFISTGVALIFRKFINPALEERKRDQAKQWADYLYEKQQTK